MTNLPGPPPAEGVRIPWGAIDAAVRARLDAWLGSPVVEAVTQVGGFSPGVAARLRTADGRRVFAKGVQGSTNAFSREALRREARILAALPNSAPVPRLLWQHDDGSDDGWVVLVIEDLEGRAPGAPWTEREVDLVVATVDGLAETLSPSPLPRGLAEPVAEWDVMHRPWWAELAADPPPGLDPWSARNAEALARVQAFAPEGGRGEALVHLDLRADNMLVAGGRVYVVDWAHARIGAAWNDVIWLAPSVEMQGGPACADLFARCASTRGADEDRVTAVLAAVTGFFIGMSLQPPLPGLPTLRPFQAAQGLYARQWLAERTGLA